MLNLFMDEIGPYLTGLKNPSKVESELIEIYGRCSNLTCITSVAPEDLVTRGFDVSDVDEGTMRQIASEMQDLYLERCFWDDLESIAYKLDVPNTQEMNEP